MAFFSSIYVSITIFMSYRKDHLHLLGLVPSAMLRHLTHHPMPPTKGPQRGGPELFTLWVWAVLSGLLLGKRIGDFTMEKWGQKLSGPGEQGECHQWWVILVACSPDMTWREGYVTSKAQSNHANDIRQTQIGGHCTEYLIRTPRNGQSHPNKENLRHCHRPEEVKETW